MIHLQCLLNLKRFVSAFFPFFWIWYCACWSTANRSRFQTPFLTNVPVFQRRISPQPNTLRNQTAFGVPNPPLSPWRKIRATDKAASIEPSAVIVEPTIPETKAKARMKEEKVPTAPLRREPRVVGTPKDDAAKVEQVSHRLRNRWQWWSRHGPPRVLDLLMCGLFPNIKLDVFGKGHPVACTDEELTFAGETFCEYETIGAVERTLPSLIKYFVPWFLVSKQEPNGNIKKRFITNLKNVSHFINTNPFGLDHRGVVFPGFAPRHVCFKSRPVACILPLSPVSQLF